ncbi:MAG: hypothetical protein ABI460_01430 [Caldimonas sp.]
MTGFASGNARLMASSIFTRLRNPLFLLACLIAAAAVNAAEPARGAASAPTPRTPPLLTPTQLRDCMATKERLHAQTDDALKDKAAVEAEKAEIARSGASLAEQVVSLDKTSAEAVDGYNAKVEARDKMIDSYQAKVAAYNVKAEAVQATKDGYEKTCELRRYDERDLNDLKRKK